MAGRGSRLRPHTLITPKPLICVSGKPIVQHLVEEIVSVCNEKVDEIAFIIGDFGKEVERNLMSERASAGRIEARARGRFGGRPEKLNSKDLKLLKTLYDNGTPIKTIAEQWQVSRTTIYRYLNKLKDEKSYK